MRVRSAAAAGAATCLLLGACTDDGAGPQAASTPTASANPTASATATASASCLPFGGTPDGSAARPYLKRSMALTCREDVKRIQSALGLPADGRFDFDTAAAVIATTKPYGCITANDGQVGPQTWALIIDGVEPCRPGTASPTAVPSWARCADAVAVWALRAVDETVLRRCGATLELVYDGDTLVSPVQELGSSVCAEFDERFSGPASRTILCVSDPATDDTLEAGSAAGDDGLQTVWSEEIEDRYLRGG